MSAHILIVDDNPTNLKLAVDVLTFEGYNVASAENAERAMQMLANLQPALILMDISMPGVDGLTLTRRLKAAKATAGITIVALTASAMKGDEGKAREAGCDGYITKPIDTRKFSAQIAEILSARAGAGGGAIST